MLTGVLGILVKKCKRCLVKGKLYHINMWCFFNSTFIALVSIALLRRHVAVSKRYLLAYPNFIGKQIKVKTSLNTWSNCYLWDKNLNKSSRTYSMDKKKPHLQSSLPFVVLMLKTFALQPLHQTLKYSLRVPNGWLSVEFLYNLANVQPHNGCELNIEVFESLCYDKTSASNFDTAW